MAISLLVTESVSLLEPYWTSIDQVTIVGTPMGTKGTSMDPSIPAKIREARAAIEERGTRVEIQVDGWDRHRLLEDLSRTFSEAGMNIVEATCTANPPMIRNRFVVECADTQTLKTTISRLRNIDSVFDAFRVTPGN